MTEYEEIQEQCLTLLAIIHKSERAVVAIEAEQARVNDSYEKRKAVELDARRRAIDSFAAIMEKTGEVEVVLPGENVDYVVRWTTPRESVKIVDIRAVPDEYLNEPAERTAKKKEIGLYIKECRKLNKPLPNWAVMEKGKSELTWGSRKKGKEEPLE